VKVPVVRSSSSGQSASVPLVHSTTSRGAAQARCARLTVIVPDYAKSAATLLALGAHEILMGPTSDLRPVDPQFQLSEFDLVSAKDMIAAVERALDDVAERPDTYPLHASLLADVGALKAEQARSALARTDDLVREALSSHPERGSDDVDELVQRLHEPLIEALRSMQQSSAPTMPGSLACR
jgi:hypothetical protein